MVGGVSYSVSQFYQAKINPILAYIPNKLSNGTIPSVYVCALDVNDKESEIKINK